VEFIETPTFTRLIGRLMDDDEYAKLQLALARRPDWVMKKELFEELKQSLSEANLIKRGQLKPGHVFHVKPESNIVRVRGKLGLSQSKFAAILGISADTLQNWEQGRRTPTGPAKVLLKIAARHPEVLLEVAYPGEADGSQRQPPRRSHVKRVKL
jgi:putative transcriptional regulator